VLTSRWTGIEETLATPRHFGSRDDGRGWSRWLRW
jgi:hypothetical protein